MKEPNLPNLPKLLNEKQNLKLKRIYSKVQVTKELIEVLKEKEEKDFLKNPPSGIPLKEFVQNDPSNAVFYSLEIIENHYLDNKLYKEKIENRNKTLQKIISKNLEMKEIYRITSENYIIGLNENQNSKLQEIFLKETPKNLTEQKKLNLQNEYIKNGLSKETLNKIQKDPHKAIYYALKIAKDRNKTLEKIISQNAEIKNIYEIEISKIESIKFKTPSSLEIEEAIAIVAFDELKSNKSNLSKEIILEYKEIISENALYSFKYATEVLKKPFPKGAIAIGKDKILAKKYLSFCANPTNWNNENPTNNKIDLNKEERVLYILKYIENSVQ